jgi:DNA-binding XRE family transcriptional regulator
VEGAVNNVQKFREAQLLGKAEFARKAGVSESTLDRVEQGKGCRLETKRKIILALGLQLQDSTKLFRKPSPPHKGGRANGRGRGK